MSSLTGESTPVYVNTGDKIISGSVNISGVIKAKTDKKYSDSEVSKILELVEHAETHKAESEKFITRFARYYTPAVVICAVFIALILPVVTKTAFASWVKRAIIFLVISCPCAMVVSVPLTFFAGIGKASSLGILVKGGSYLEKLAYIKTAVFDKTGTLTYGKFEVSGIYPVKLSETEFLETVSTVESSSNHPIAKSVLKKYGKTIDLKSVSSIKEKPGYGVSALYKQKKILVGNKKLMDENKIKINEEIDGVVLYVAIDGEFAGAITFEDKIKENAVKAVKNLKSLGAMHTYLLTGDKAQNATKTAEILNLSGAYSDPLPADKVIKLEEVMKKHKESGAVIYTGDGINDAPVLKRADIGIAMGALGSDAAIEAADIVIMTDDPYKIVDAVKIAKKTIKIVKQNITFAIFTKFLILFLATFLETSMWAAVFGSWSIDTHCI